MILRAFASTFDCLLKAVLSYTTPAIYHHHSRQGLFLRWNACLGNNSLRGFFPCSVAFSLKQFKATPLRFMNILLNSSYRLLWSFKIIIWNVLSVANCFWFWLQKLCLGDISAESWQDCHIELQIFLSGGLLWDLPPFFHHALLVFYWMLCFLWVPLASCPGYQKVSYNFSGKPECSGYWVQNVPLEWDLKLEVGLKEHRIA